MGRKKFLIWLIAFIIISLLAACVPTNAPLDLVGTANSQQAPNNEIDLPETGTQDASVPELLTLPAATFEDVPYDYCEALNGEDYYLYDYIQDLYDNGFTSGTSIDPPLYSPTKIIDRVHFAVFLLRAKFGMDFIPQEPAEQAFIVDDWTTLPEYQKWAEGMFEAQFTSGCQADPLMFCPYKELSRLEAAIFALHLMFNQYDNEGKLIYAYEPPQASGNVFADMSDPSFYGTSWAEAAYSYDLLPACGTSGGKPMFCPDDLVDRAWAAYIIHQARNINLQ